MACRVEEPSLPGGYAVGDRVKSTIKWGRRAISAVVQLIGDEGIVKGPGTTENRPGRLDVLFDSGGRSNIRTPRSYKIWVFHLRYLMLPHQIIPLNKVCVFLGNN